MRRKTKEIMAPMQLVVIGVILMAFGFAVKLTAGDVGNTIDILFGTIPIWTGLGCLSIGSILFLSNLLIRGRR